MHIDLVILAHKKAANSAACVFLDNQHVALIPADHMLSKFVIQKAHIAIIVKERNGQ